MPKPAVKKNHYRNCPIVEVVCEFRFPSLPDWDVTIPGVLYEKLKSQFPIKEFGQHFAIGLTNRGPDEIKNIQISSPVRFIRQDRTALIQVAPGLLAINQLPPYPRWETFKPFVQDIFGEFAKLHNVNGLKQMGLRYINRIDIPGDRIDLHDYFKYYPEIDKSLPQDFTDYRLRAVFPMEQKGNRLILTLASAKPVTEGCQSAILDIDYIVSSNDDLKGEQAFVSLETAHNAIENVFENCLTQKSKELCGIQR